MALKAKRDEKPLTERITNAYHELVLARRDGCGEWIDKARQQLDALLDELPRTAQQPKR